MPNYKSMMETWKDWRLDEATLENETNLPFSLNLPNPIETYLSSSDSRSKDLAILLYDSKMFKSLTSHNIINYRFNFTIFTTRSTYWLIFIY